MGKEERRKKWHDYMESKGVRAILQECVQQLCRNQPDDINLFLMQHFTKQCEVRGSSLYVSGSPKTTATTHDSFQSHLSIRQTRRNRRKGRCQEEISTSILLNPDTSVLHQQPEIVERIIALMAEIWFFKDLDTVEKKCVIAEITEAYKAPGEEIIHQGDEGDNFYLIKNGVVDVLVNEVKVAQLEKGKYFGEVALLYDTPRTATVRAVTDVELWVLRRSCYKMAVMREKIKKSEKYEKFLKNVVLFENLSNEEVSRIADALVPTSYNDCETIIQEGDIGNDFYILVEGRAICTKLNEDGVEEMVKEYGPADYFGELALLQNLPRQATVKADGALHCVRLDRGSFERLLGPCKDVMGRHAHRYVSPTALGRESVASKSMRGGSDD